MVRKVMVVFLLALSLMTAQASAYDVYTEGNISSSYTTIFKDVIGSVPVTDDYVFFRSGQYDYTLISGDLTYENGVFTSSVPCTVYTLSYSQSGYSTTTYDYQVFQTSSVSLAVGSNLVYSNLGNFPTLEERSDIYAFCSLLVLCSIGLCVVLRSVFSFCSRKRI